jgi:hypothetical protein
MQLIARSKGHMTAPNLPRVGLLIVSFMLAILAFAPTQAQAHEGHNHGGQVSRQAPVVRNVAPTGGEIAQFTHPQMLTSGVASGGQLTAILPAQSSKGCLGGCCQRAGASCCQVFLTAASPVVTPPVDNVVFASPPDSGAGITPGALSKPPKSLV